jgi:small subunit ribosomal protein S2
MGVKTVALIDTDCDPDLIDIPIPGNDDGIRSIEVILRHLADAVLEGKKAGGIEVEKGEQLTVAPEMAVSS